MKYLLDQYSSGKHDDGSGSRDVAYLTNQEPLREAIRKDQTQILVIVFFLSYDYIRA